MKKEWKYIALLAGIFGILVVVELNKPKPIDWRPTFSKKDKIPYGNYVLGDMITDIFGLGNFSSTNKTIYETIGQKTDITSYITKEEQPVQASYIFINEQFSPDKLDTETLLQFVANGNNVFVAANHFQGTFADTLKIKTNDYLFSELHANDSALTMKLDSLSLNFVNPVLKKEKNYGYKNGTIPYFFSSFDSSTAVILGVTSKYKPTYIKLSFGQGNIYLSSTPIAFTNYNMLFQNNAEYVGGAFSYLPVGNVIWDEYYKVGRGEEETPLRFILSKTALAWAYGITIVSLFCYILFEAKRRQRIIPIVAPPQNATLEFVDTIGRLYYQYGDHKNLAHKKITYFLESVRSRFYLKTNMLDEEFVKKLSEKSNIEKEQVKMLISLIRKINESDSVTEEALIRLSDMIDRFNRIDEIKERK
ncbi:MAG TPA: DUF4350 domain-containing protein [Cytophagaceae bacterium]|jgi:hypothetical protein|nr:DUF4350 domain-containing protein [Cytophagaceae bacterium]